MKFYLLLSTVLLVGALHLTAAQKSVREAQKAIFAELFSESNYDRQIRPAGHNETAEDDHPTPVAVTVDMLIRAVEKLDDQKNAWTAQVTYRSSWTDDRLVYDDHNGTIRYLTLTETERLWFPDTFFKNEKESYFHAMPSPNTLVRIYPNGRIMYSTRLTLTLQCPMILTAFPADKQVCGITLASYAHTVDDIMYVWKEGSPIQVSANLWIPLFTMEKYLTSYCSSTTNTGSYSCLEVAFLFRRHVSHYLLTLYIPLAMFVLVSWVTFWINPKTDFTSRTVLSLGALLGAAALIAHANQATAPVSYCRLVDTYTGVCLAFIFAAILESATVNYTLKQATNSLSAAVTMSGESKQLVALMRSGKLDRIARIAFPVAFLLFVIVYSCVTFT